MSDSIVGLQAPAQVQREDLNSELLQNRLAFVLHNVLNKYECAAVIRAAEGVGFKPATVRTGFKTMEYQPDFRVGDNSYLTDVDIRETIFQRIRPHLPPKFGFGKLVGLNERMTVLRYGPGGFFGEHRDGTYITADDSAISFITVQLYLNEGFEGGETTFFPDGLMRAGDKPEDRRRVAMMPRTGSAVIFEHKILHEGSLVQSGVKFTLRADVLYSRYYPPTGTDFDRVNGKTDEPTESGFPPISLSERQSLWSRCAVQ
ncbi:hypothetical protein BOX15_Mlig003838g4 [Macrostomum lignano]|uniref:Fe2OG dioxygenase domain-containing protein n=1 Tax=Macrostomum lignano TaxID=282301 RepID=A0A267DB09_9PLAT|nr:hypothetical protein BOX15_Mlig003838g4 [Macrostomum lignano]